MIESIIATLQKENKPINYNTVAGRITSEAVSTSGDNKYMLIGTSDISKYFREKYGTQNPQTV